MRKIEISEDERTNVDLRENTETKRIEWDVEKDTPLHVDFSTDEKEYLKMVCEKISDEQLPDDMWQTVESLFDEVVKAK